ncbi:MAG: dihydropteroate synthase, partial [Acidobacteria bacterium]
MRSTCSWRLSRSVIPLGHRTVIMGVLNVTPDSFSDGGLYFDRESAIARAKEIEQEGADIMDIGGESTRPGSEAISEEEEMRRVLPIIESVVRTVTIPISIDTYRATVAKRAVEVGAQIV